MTKLILIRHGQSVWNAENKFTGWVDARLSSRGIAEACKAGKLLRNANVKIQYCFTSFLSRAIDTLNILLSQLENENKPKINKFWELNERHYGSLTGLNKSETKKKIGDTMFLKYRRSWDISPPAIEKNNKNLKQFSKLNKSISLENIPTTESLKDTYRRVTKFYKENIADLLLNNNTVIISAHGNSLRALYKYLFKISDKDIISLEIPTGNPMIINFEKKLKIKEAYYLDKNRAMSLI